MEFNAQTVTAIVSGVVAAATAIAGIIVGVKRARDNERREDEVREEERRMRMEMFRSNNNNSCGNNSTVLGLPIYNTNNQLQQQNQNLQQQMNQMTMMYQMKINELERRVQLQQDVYNNMMRPQMQQPQMGYYPPITQTYYNQPQQPRYGYGYSNMVNDETVWAGERAYGTPGPIYQGQYQPRPIQTSYNNNYGYGYGYGYA